MRERREGEETGREEENDENYKLGSAVGGQSPPYSVSLSLMSVRFACAAVALGAAPECDRWSRNTHGMGWNRMGWDGIGWAGMAWSTAAWGGWGWNFTEMK